jgi:hypothetical protein
MGKFAVYDPAVGPPSPVTAWVDTDPDGVNVGQADPPDAVVMTDAEWDARVFSYTQYVVEAGGVLTPITTLPSVPFVATATVLSSDLLVDGAAILLTIMLRLQIRDIAIEYKSGLGLPGGAERWNCGGAMLTGDETVSLFQAIRAGPQVSLSVTL